MTKMQEEMILLLNGSTDFSTGERERDWIYSTKATRVISETNESKKVHSSIEIYVICFMSKAHFRQLTRDQFFLAQEL